LFKPPYYKSVLARELVEAVPARHNVITTTKGPAGCSVRTGTIKAIFLELFKSFVLLDINVDRRVRELGESLERGCVYIYTYLPWLSGPGTLCWIFGSLMDCCGSFICG
jgi:hypothetical protein